MRKKILLSILTILPLIFLSGCVSQRVGDGVTISLYADPSTIFGRGSTLLYIDTDNRDTKTVENVVVSVFDTGLLKLANDNKNIYGDAKCLSNYKDLKPNQFNTFSCRLFAPVIEQTSLQTDVNVKATFDTEFSLVQLAELMTVDEYDRRIASRNFRQLPKSYSYRDKYVELQIDFSEQLPIVVRPEKKYFVYFTIKNVGNGFINPIKPENFYFKQSSDLIQCEQTAGKKTFLLNKNLDIIGKEFPRLACEVKMPPNVNYLENYEMVIYLKYSYEIRDKITVNIVR